MANVMSDNCSGVHPGIMQSILDCNAGAAAAYGNDELTRQAENKFCELFGKDITVAFLTSGTAANCLALSLYTPSYGAILCHKHAHIQEDEYGAPGLFTGGAQLIPLEGEHGKIDPAALKSALARATSLSLKCTMLSITQATESGTVYTLSELAELTAIAKQAGLKVHMDGARFANALVTLACTSAEMTWKLGIDVLSFGGTKNGCLAAEAVIVFDNNPHMKDKLLLKRKKSGHTLSKMRFLSAQFLAYLKDDLWLQSARHANAMARRLEQSLNMKPVHPVEANEVFVLLPPDIARNVMDDGHQFFDWPDGSYRFVTSFATTAEDIDALASSLAQHDR